MMRGIVLCILKGGRRTCCHQYYHELKFHGGQVSVSRFCKIPFLQEMEINFFLILLISEKIFFLFMYVVSKYLRENGKDHNRVMRLQT